MKKRAFSFFAILLALCLLLASCGAGGAYTPALFTVVGDAVSGFFTTSSNLLRGSLPVVLDGQLLYQPTFHADCKAEAEAMLDRLYQTTGIERVQVVSSIDVPQLRMDLGLKAGLSASEFYIGLDGKDLIITANNLPMLTEGIRYFESAYITGAEANVGTGYLYLPKGLSFTSPTVDLIDADGEPLYTICYPENADSSAIGAISVLRDAVKEKTGATLSLQSDFLAADTGDSKEILVGLTNRTESVAATADLGYDAYCWSITENKIVITAQNTFMLRKGIEAFTELFVLGEDAAASYDPSYLRLPCSLNRVESRSMLLFANDYHSDYTLVYPNGTSVDVMNHIRAFQNQVGQLTGASIPAYADTAHPVDNLSGGNREILIGNTNRHPVSTVASNTWRLTVSGSDIRIETSNANHVRFALQSLYLVLKDCAESQNAVNSKDQNPKYPMICLDTSLELQGSNAPDLPSFSGIVDAGEGAYMLYQKDSDMARFSSYQAMLTSMGYALYTHGTAASVHSATYYNDTEILNLSFTETDNVLRVVVDPSTESALHPLTPVKYSTKTNVQPKFVQLGGMSGIYKSADCGMSYLVRLTDGTFVVVDGGYSNEECANKLMNALEALNELSGKPVISCWIFTHAHSDHIGGFRTFTNKFASKVELKSVLYSFPSSEQAMIHGGNGVVQMQLTFREYIKEYGGNPVVYKARTGQKLQFADCEIEMLFTFEDYVWPKELSYFNDSSTVFGLTLSDGNISQRFMMLGDCSEATSPILVARYGDYLQSDAVQVAHHGYAGGTAALYNAIQAAVVFWPCPLYNPNDTGSLRFNNPKWSKVTRVMLGQSYAKVLYVAGDGDITLSLTQVKNRTLVGIARTAESAKYPS